jgi:hypothetical protein
MWNKQAWIARSLSVVIFLTAGWVEAKKHTGQAGYSGGGVKISPDDDEFDHDGDKLWVKLKVENTSDNFILIDRNLIEAKAPDGKTFKRILPVTGKGDAYVLPPGKTETITMEYASPKDAPVVLLLKGFFGLDTKPITLANYSISLGK